MKRHRNVYDDMLEFVFDILTALRNPAEVKLSGELPQEIWVKLSEKLLSGRRESAALRVLLKMVERAEEPGTAWRTSRVRREERLERFKAVLLELVKRTPPLLEGSTPAGRVASFHRFGAHVETLWRDAVVLYRAGSFARACFVAITCLEEIGKAVPGRVNVKFESLGEKLEDKLGQALPRGGERRAPG